MNISTLLINDLNKCLSLTQPFQEIDLFTRMFIKSMNCKSTHLSIRIDD
jgi:hypothetical protein